MVITWLMRKVGIETDGCRALSTIPARIAKTNARFIHLDRKSPLLHRDCAMDLSRENPQLTVQEVIFGQLEALGIISS